MDRFLVILPRYSCGFFSHFFQVLAMLDYADLRQLIPIVFFNRDFAYWSEKPYNNTRNAWEYFFEPVSEYRLDDLTGRSEDELLGMSTEQLLRLEYGNIQFSNEFRESLGTCGLMSERQRKRSAELIQKYIRIREPILQRASEFMKNHFTPTMVGIHYRGTDKKKDWPISAEIGIKEYVKAIKNFPEQNIFAATDCKKASEFFVRRFNVITSDSERTNATVAVHQQKGMSGPRLGEDVLLDCLLLSRCNHLIHGLSNVSAAALAFNPQLNNTDLFL